MANFFSNMLDKDGTARKLKKEVEGMELKKQSLIATVQNEINTARRQIDSELYQIGSDVYGSHVSGEDIDEKLTAHYSEIESLKGLIAEKEEKIKGIASRYDDEIGMLNAHLGTAQPPAPHTRSAKTAAQGSAGASCENCGKPYTPGEDMFCMGCGQKLAAPGQPFISDTNPQGSHAGASCKNCGNPYIPGEDMFCTGCGQKLQP